MFALNLSDDLEVAMSQDEIYRQLDAREQMFAEREPSIWMRALEAVGKDGLQAVAKLGSMMTNSEVGMFSFFAKDSTIETIQYGLDSEVNVGSNGPEEITIQLKSPTAILDPVWPQNSKLKFRCFLGVPVMFQESTIGVLSVVSNEPSLLSKKNADLLETLSKLLELSITIQTRVFGSVKAMEDAHGQIRELTAYAKILQDQHLTLQQKEEELGRLNVRLQDLADTDGLTGLYNHRACYEILLDRFRSGLPTSLILIDLDNFKGYNDEFGHVEGDALLAGVSSLIKQIAGEDNPVCRYGGEELAVIVKTSDEQVAMNLAEKIRAMVASYPFRTRQVTFTAGVAILQPSVESVEDLVRRADQALYAGKRSGKNKVLSWNS